MSHVASVAVEVEQRGRRLGALLRLGNPEGVQSDIVGCLDADRNVRQVVHCRNGYVNAGVGWQVRMVEKQVLGIVEYHCKGRHLVTNDWSEAEYVRRMIPAKSANVM